MDLAINSATPELSRRRFRLRTLLLSVNLIILGMCLLGFFSARFYESEQLRQTEQLLIEQASLIVGVVQFIQPQSLKHEPNAGGANTSAQAWPDWDNPLNVFRSEVLPESPAPKVAAGTLKPQNSLRSGALQGYLDALNEDTTDVTVISKRGDILASNRFKVGALWEPQGEVLSALEGGAARVIRRCGVDMRCVVLAVPVSRDGDIVGAVILSRAPVSLFRALLNHKGAIAIWLVIILVAVTAQTLYTSKIVIAPIHDLIHQAEQLVRGEREGLQILEHPVTFEVQRLSLGLVTMAQALDERASYIRTFASNVSHEFKTPLASVRGAVELLADHGEAMPLEKRLHFLDMIERHAERLQRLVERLLELARADVLSPSRESAPVADVIHFAIARYHLEGDPIVVQLGPGLERGVEAAISSEVLDSILSNLIDNALQHAGSAPHVTIRAAADDAHVTIEVEDDGLGISEANRDHIFTTFFTTARDKGGTGVGLSVVVALLRAHGGQISLVPQGPTCFRLSLPRSKGA